MVKVGSNFSFDQEKSHTCNSCKIPFRNDTKLIKTRSQQKLNDYYEKKPAQKGRLIKLTKLNYS